MRHAVKAILSRTETFDTQRDNIKNNNNMNYNISKNLKKLAVGAMLCLSGIAFTNCTDPLENENRFISTGQSIADYLEEDSAGRFTLFCEILEKASIGKKAAGNMLKTLSTYGSYTCFAPTNEAVRSYIKEQYKQYIDEGKETGVTSEDISELTKEKATEIAKNHIIERGYKTIDISKGVFPNVTMNRRSVYVNWVETPTGYNIVLDQSAIIKEQDIETENGYVQVIDKMLSPSNNMLPAQIKLHDEFRLFAEAIYATGLDSILDLYDNIDPDYDGLLFGPITIEKEGEAPYPEELHQRYTVLVETNATFANSENNHLGIEIRDIPSLYKLAKSIYGDAAEDNYKDTANALYKFMAYHIIDRQLEYSSSDGPGGFIMENYTSSNGFKSEVNMPTRFDRYDYFETMMPYTLIKVTKPFTNTKLKAENNNETPIVLNYAQEKGTYLLPRTDNIDMSKYINVIVQHAENSGVKDFAQSAINGTIHTINKILVYDAKEMSGNILNERMRWDVSSLFPELTNNRVRWARNDVYKITYIPNGYCERLITNSADANVYYLRPYGTSIGGYPNYQGDELLVTGKYDFQYRIPHVPPGDYEIRFGYSASNLRGVCQFYFDGEICGIPVDMRANKENTAFVGWFEEEDMQEDEIRENDKAMRNRGFMKGPASCVLEETGESMRDSELALRKIITTKKLGRGDHWLRFKNVTENSTTDQFNQDYLELVPTTVITNQSKPEDIN